jgi:DNA replication protein DnaC
MTPDLRARLRAIGLLTTSSTLDDLVALATKKRWGPAETLEHIADLEEKDRARRGLERRMSRSRLEKFKPMTDFDWNWPKKIERPFVESLLCLDFLEGARNVVLVAPGGLGKTMIAQNIAHRAVLAGRSVLFLSAVQLLLDLAAQESARALERRLRYFAKVGLLVSDELGFLAFDNRNAELIFQVVSRRTRRRVSFSPQISRSPTGTLSSPAPPAPPPSSSASSTTPTSSSSRTSATACANPSSPPKRAEPHAVERNSHQRRIEPGCSLFAGSGRSSTPCNPRTDPLRCAPRHLALAVHLRLRVERLDRAQLPQQPPRPTTGRSPVLC